MVPLSVRRPEERHLTAHRCVCATMMEREMCDGETAKMECSVERRKGKTEVLIHCGER